MTVTEGTAFREYVEFSGANGDITPLALGRENLVVLRTLSKAWGLAGIRLGYCVASPPLVSHLLDMKAPYNINAVTLQLAARALGNPGFLASAVAAIVGERSRLAAALAKIPPVIRVHPSDANFLLVEFGDAGAAYRMLSGRGIIVLRRSEPRLNRCLRVTVGTPAENDLLVEALEELA